MNTRNKARIERITDNVAAGLIVIVIIFVVRRLFFKDKPEMLGNASYNRKIENAIKGLTAQNKNYRHRYLKANETERAELIRRIETNNKEIRKLQKTMDSEQED